MIIDFQRHYLPAEFKGKGRFRPPAVYDIDEHLRNMDITGVDMVVLSSWTADLEDCKIINERLHQLQARYPKRIVGLASAPPLGGKEALDELERGIKVLGLKGVIVTAQVEDKPLDDSQLWPFYSKVQELGIPIFVHPSYALKGFSALNASYPLDQKLGWELELMTATVRLILGGVLEDFPELKIVISHFGGGLAAVLERLTGPGTGKASSALSSDKIKKPIHHYLDKLYFDMAGYSGGMRAVQCYLTALKPQHLIFGTDYPMNFEGEPEQIRKYIENIRSLNLSDDTKEDMLGNNAYRLLKL